MNSKRIAQAARNNALWCDAVCRANGAPGEFHHALWLNRHQVPNFYSNAVTLTAAGAAEQLARIGELAAERPSFSVKDSFASLDLRPLGFTVLFEATWLRREAGVAVDEAAAEGWSVVADVAGLARWEATWAGLHDELVVAEDQRTFPPALLDEPGIYFLAGTRDGRIESVAALNLTGDAVGLSNVFGPPERSRERYAGAVAFAGRLFPGRPLVGYERGDDLAAATSAGFTPIGALRVWLRHGE